MYKFPSFSQTGRRICGLDSLRFICAIWVAMHHGARPEIAAWLGLSSVAADWNAVAFDGVAAVIVFFVISGLCVHYPNARSEPLDLPAYFAQRFVRVGIPLAVVAAFVKFSGGLVGEDVATAPRMVLWSLWCELIYYAIYPAFLIAFRRIGIVPVLAAAFAAACLVVVCHWDLMTAGVAVGLRHRGETGQRAVADPAWLGLVVPRRGAGAVDSTEGFGLRVHLTRFDRQSRDAFGVRHLCILLAD
jgi:peptidoglycan/LPS O-acetylase OafA/YrhL